VRVLSHIGVRDSQIFRLERSLTTAIFPVQNADAAADPALGIGLEVVSSRRRGRAIHCSLVPQYMKSTLFCFVFRDEYPQSKHRDAQPEGEPAVNRHETQ
jgi:hypothetical protein